MRHPLVLDPNCMYCGRRFSRPNVARYEKACGAGLGSRYQILAVTGYKITPGNAVHGGEPTHKAPTAWCVLDSEGMGREVAVFSSIQFRGKSNESIRVRAETLCRELNAGEKEEAA